MYGWRELTLFDALRAFRLVDLLVQSGVGRYIDFKLVDGSYIISGSGSSITTARASQCAAHDCKEDRRSRGRREKRVNITRPHRVIDRVPCSKRDVFKTRALNAARRRQDITNLSYCFMSVYRPTAQRILLLRVLSNHIFQTLFLVVFCFFVCVCVIPRLRRGV